MNNYPRPPKKSSLPHIESEEQRDDVIRELSPNHGYSISEAIYLLNVCRKTIQRYIIDGTLTPKYRGVHPLITGLQLKNIYFN